MTIENLREEKLQAGEIEPAKMNVLIRKVRIHVRTDELLVRHANDQDSSGPEHAQYLGAAFVQVKHMLEHVATDGEIERAIAVGKIFDPRKRHVDAGVSGDPKIVEADVYAVTR